MCLKIASHSSCGHWPVFWTDVQFVLCWHKFSSMITLFHNPIFPLPKWILFRKPWSIRLICAWWITNYSEKNSSSWPRSSEQDKEGATELHVLQVRQPFPLISTQPSTGVKSHRPNRVLSSEGFIFTQHPYYHLEDWILSLKSLHDFQNTTTTLLTAHI